MKRWAKPGAIAVAAFLAIAAGTAAYALHGMDTGSEPTHQAAGADAAATASAGRPGLAVCTRDQADCNERGTTPPELTCEEADACATAVAPSCAFAATPCDDTPGGCTADAVCASPLPCVPVCQAPVPPTVICQAGVPVESCYPNARPAGPYVCESPAPGTTVPMCHPPYCEQPYPAEDVPPECAPVEPPPCPPIEKAGCGCTVPLAEGAIPMLCLPPDCSTSSDGTTACPPPPSPCRVLSDGTTACPAPLPPCAVSSSGVVTCPEPMPPCAASRDGTVTCPMPVPPICEPDTGCSEPGAPPSGGGVTNGTVTPG